MTRRSLLTAGALALARGVADAAPAGKVKFGLDLYSLRSQGWTPIQYLDFGAKWGIEVIHFSEVRFLGSLEEANLKEVRAHAGEGGDRSRDRDALHLPHARPSSTNRRERPKSSLDAWPPRRPP